MSTTKVKVGLAALAAFLTASTGELATASVSRSDNIRRLTSIVGLPPGTRSSVWDAAFQGDLLVAAVDGNDPDDPEAEEGAVLYRILQDKPYLELLSFYRCRGNYGDVAVWGDHLFIPVPATATVGPSLEASNDQTSARCNNTHDSVGRGGVRIVNISDPSRPKQVGFVATRCGANHLAVMPHGGELVIYGSFDCPEDMPTPVSGGYGSMIVVCFDPSRPSAADSCSKADISPLLGCLDVTVHVERRIGACIDQDAFALLDLSDPYNPKMGRSVPLSRLLFSGAFTWDGQYLAVTEGGVNTAGEQCGGHPDTSPRVRFFNVENPAEPVEVGSWGMPRLALPPCFASTVGMMPTRDGSYRATVAFGSGGMSVIDFTRPASPSEAAFYAWPKHPVYNAYWYNGRIYALRGATETVAEAVAEADLESLVTVLRMEGTGPRRMRFFRGRFNPQSLVEDFR